MAVLTTIDIARVVFALISPMFSVTLADGLSLLTSNTVTTVPTIQGFAGTNATVFTGPACVTNATFWATTLASVNFDTVMNLSEE